MKFSYYEQRIGCLSFQFNQDNQFKLLRRVFRIRKYDYQSHVSRSQEVFITTLKMFANTGSKFWHKSYLITLESLRIPMGRARASCSSSIVRMMNMLVVTAVTQPSTLGANILIESMVRYGVLVRYKGLQNSFLMASSKFTRMISRRMIRLTIDSARIKYHYYEADQRAAYLRKPSHQIYLQCLD